MGIFSWLRRKPADRPKPKHSLVRYRYEDPSRADIERAAAADVEAVEQDDKYFGGQAPGDPEHPEHPQHPQHER